MDKGWITHWPDRLLSDPGLLGMGMVTDVISAGPDGASNAKYNVSIRCVIKTMIKHTISKSSKVFKSPGCKIKKLFAIPGITKIHKTIINISQIISIKKLPVIPSITYFSLIISHLGCHYYITCSTASPPMINVSGDQHI